MLKQPLNLYTCVGSCLHRCEAVNFTWMRNCYALSAGSDDDDKNDNVDDNDGTNYDCDYDMMMVMSSVCVCCTNHHVLRFDKDYESVVPFV